MRTRSLFLALSLAAVSLPVRAANFYWGGDANNSLQTLGNWWTDVANTASAVAIPGVNDVAVFNSNVVVNPFATLGANTSLQGISFNGNSSTPITIGTLNDYVLTLGTAGIAVQSGAGAHVINSSLNVNATQTWNNVSGNPLTVAGTLTLGATAGQILNLTGTSGIAITGATSTAASRTINITNTGGVTFADIAIGTNNVLTIDTGAGVTAQINGVMSGSNFHKDGLGTVEFNATNTFSGNLRIIEGTVKVNASNSASSSGQIIFGNAGGGLGTDGFGTLTLDNNTAVTFRLGGTLYVHPASDGAIINSAGGGSAVSTLALYANRSFIVNQTSAATDLLVAVGISNGNAAINTLTKQSIGTMVMQGVNSYLGGTFVERGTLVLDYTINNGDNKLSNTAALTLRGGTLVMDGNATAATSETAQSLAVGRGLNTLSLQSNGQAVTLNLTNGLSRSVGEGILRITTNDPANATITVAGGLTNNATGILGGWAIYGDRWATRTAGNQIAALTGTIQNNKALWVAADHVVVDGALTGVLKTSEIASLIFDAPVANTLTIDGNTRVLTLAAGAILITADVGANNTLITGGLLMSKTSTVNSVNEMIITNLSTGTLRIEATLATSNTPQSTTQHVVLGGSGVIELAGRNHYNGTTYVQGNVRVSGGQTINDFATLSIAAGGEMTSIGAVFDLNGGAESVGNLTGGGATDDTYSEVGVGEIRLGTGGSLTINQTSNTTLNARVTGTNATLTKLGAGTLTTSQNNAHTMSGEIRVFGGMIDLLGGATGFGSINTVRLRGGQIRSEQNATDASINKINNNATLILEGTTGNGFAVTSNQNATRTESLQALQLASGSNVITLDNTAATTTAALTTLAFTGATSFSRTNGGTLYVRGPSLGGTPSATNDATRVTFTNATNINTYLIGTSTTAGATNLKILPFAIGDSLTGFGDSFLTVDATVGNSLRTLASGEYATVYGTAAADANLRLSASASTLATKTLNSLRIDSSAGGVLLEGDDGIVSGNPAAVLTLTSGGLLATAGASDNDTMIRGYGSILAGTSALTADELIVHVTSSNAIPSGASLRIESTIADNGGATSVTKSGGGTLVLAGANSYTGITTVNEGVLEFSSAANLGTGGMRLAGGTLRWAAGNTADITAGGAQVTLLGASNYFTPGAGGNIMGVGNVFDVGTNNVTLSGSIGGSGYGGLTKIGSGTLTLSTAPTYTGNTVISEGTMNFANIAANTMEGLYLVSSTGGTLSSTVTSGVNLQSLVVAGVYNGTNQVTGTFTVNGGAVNIGKGEGDDFILIGYRDTSSLGPAAGTNTVGTVDLRNASSVVLNVNRIQLGVYQGTTVGGVTNVTSSGSLLLSNTSNVITAGSITLGYSPTSVVNSTPTSTINLGTGTTTINTDSFVIGGIRSKATVTIGAGGSFTLRGQQGGDSGANLYIADNDATGTGTANTSSLTLTGASNVDMKLNLLVIGRLGGSANGGYGRGTLTFDVGVIEATTIRLADANYSDPTGTNPQNTTGTIVQAGTATMRFGNMSGGTGVATYTWTKGTVENIAGMNLVNENVNMTLAGVSTTDPSQHLFNVSAGQTATLRSTAAFVGTGSLTKGGSGSLILEGTNTNSGNVRITGGTMALSGNGVMNDAAWMNVDGGASFDIAARTGAAYTTDATISGTGTIGGAAATLTVGSNVGTVNTNGVLKPGSSSLNASLASATTVGDQTGTLTVSGNLILATNATRVDRALLQTGATDRNAASTLATYGGDIALWVDNIDTDFASFMTGAGTNHDLIGISDGLTINLNGRISVISYSGYTGRFGDVFNLLDWSGMVTDNGFVTGTRYQTGSEANLDLDLFQLSAGLVWDTSLFASNGVVVVVPEPHRAFLIFIAGAMILMRRRRR